jgi:hypothetical protein
MDAIQRSDLTRLLPQNGGDVENARALIALGYPAVEPILPSLFQWLETSGSEVELVVRPFFAALGEPALDLVRSALESPIKPARKAALLRHVLPSWPREVVAKLEPQIVSYLDAYDFHGLDTWALKLLLEKGLGERQYLEGWRQLKMMRLREQLEALEKPGSE